MLRAPTSSRPLEGSRSLPAEGPPANGSALVQARPALGSLQRVKHGRVTALRATIDFLGASAALGAVMIESGSPAWPAIPLAPLLLVGLSQVLGLYGSSDNLAEPNGGTSRSAAHGSARYDRPVRLDGIPARSPAMARASG